MLKRKEGGGRGRHNNNNNNDDDDDDHHHHHHNNNNNNNNNNKRRKGEGDGRDQARSPAPRLERPGPPLRTLAHPWESWLMDALCTEVGGENKKCLGHMARPFSCHAGRGQLLSGQSGWLVCAARGAGS